jgi:hypothetical protein
VFGVRKCTFFPLKTGGSASKSTIAYQDESSIEFGRCFSKSRDAFTTLQSNQFLDRKGCLVSSSDVSTPGVLDIIEYMHWRDFRRGEQAHQVEFQRRIDRALAQWRQGQQR